MTIRSKDEKQLWGKAAGKCSICKKELFHNGVVLGQQAHIIAKKLNGPRGESGMSEMERNTYDNLILLCSDHHDEIDKNPDAWPSEKLHEIKRQHETWVSQKFSQAQLSEIEGIFSVDAEDVEKAVVLNIKKPTRIKPGTQVSLTARNVKEAICVNIGGD